MLGDLMEKTTISCLMSNVIENKKGGLPKAEAIFLDVAMGAITPKRESKRQ